MSSISFRVDSRLPTLLSQEYRSTERALKELIDNAWDAEAETVSIILPKPMTTDPIVISDNGSGMTEVELRQQYLAIATDRRQLRGDYTAIKNRRVKGRKGIGKFAGLMAAQKMAVETKCRGKCYSFEITMAQLEKVADVEELEIPLVETSCSDDEHGTTITLSDYHHKLAFPIPDKLRQILIREYGREEGFEILVDHKRLDISDVKGLYTKEMATLPEVGTVNLRFAISEQKGKLFEPGIAIRVGGKVIGKPEFFGLESEEDFPPKLLRKLYGEIEADGLLAHVTAGWDSIIENSELMATVRQFVLPILRTAFTEQYGTEMRAAHARLHKKIQAKIAQLPEYKRDFADIAIRKILEKYYGEPDNRVEPLIFVLLEALEHSDYRVLLEHIAESPRGDISSIIDSLNRFSLAEMAFLVDQTQARISFLENLDALCSNPDTLEITVHKALEHSLWFFGPQYSLFSSNITLRRQIEDYLDKKYTGEHKSKRPDLLLNENLDGHLLLIEFKRPSHGLKHEDYRQAITYRHEFSKYIPDKIIDVFIIGGHTTDDLPKDANKEPNVRILIYKQLVSTARRQLEWLLKELSSNQMEVL